MGSQRSPSPEHGCDHDASIERSAALRRCQDAEWNGKDQSDYQGKQRKLQRGGEVFHNNTERGSAVGERGSHIAVQKPVGKPHILNGKRFVEPECRASGGDLGITGVLIHIKVRKVTRVTPKMTTTLCSSRRSMKVITAGPSFLAPSR
jgi:hypothetical protein